MESDAELDFQKLNTIQNRKNKKSGGFQSMGLSQPTFRGIIKKGYRIPTPVQRKCIPIILEGRDVVAMARTGSGKTAAFLIPLFERLKARSAKTGARALILSPTRELAMQTFKFTKELGRFTSLRAAIILGGSKMDNQFAAIHDNPDIIIATPGRFLHVIVEMDLKLTSVEYVVFDEADRLFEMGFAEQLRETLQRLPQDNRQTLLFSATLPQMLADFAKAGLTDPVLVRLDVDSKLSDQLRLAFLSCRSEDKTAVLLHLLKYILKPKELTVIFAATKHHVEYLSLVLEEAGIACTHLYSSLDQEARRINVTNFQSRKVPVLIVTDLAARGIDIPMLDVVINYNFPPKSKLFVHRVGRVARAGRSGVAYSLVGPDEVAYVLDLHLFLGRSVIYAEENKKLDDWNGVYGTVPRSIIEQEEEQLFSWHEKKIDLHNMRNVCTNAYKQYLKSRPNSSGESLRRMKEDLSIIKVAISPLYANCLNMESSSSDLINQMKSYKPSSTIFEVNATAKTPASLVMRTVRKKYKKAIENHQQKLNEKLNLSNDKLQNLVSSNAQDEENVDVENLFTDKIISKKRRSDKAFEPKRKKKKIAKTNVKETEYFVPYKPLNHYSEQGLEIDKNFNIEASGAVLDFTGDDANTLIHNRKQSKWDRKKKKFINETGKDTGKKKIKTESGNWIPATYKADLYKKWKKRHKVEEMINAQMKDDEDEDQIKNTKRPPLKHFRFKTRQKSSGEKPRRELRNKEEIFKQRKQKRQVQFNQKRRQLQRVKNKQQTGKRRK